MPSLRLLLAASLSLTACTLAFGQQDMGNSPVASSTASTGDDVAKLQAENAALKKEVADATRTITQLQAQLAQANANHPSATDTSAPDAASSTNAAPTGPQKALPLDATNAVANAAAPGAAATDTGPSKTYTVVKGDSLWKIAHKMYPGDTKNGVDKIQEANKDAIGGKPLKIGQVLIIPQ